MANIKNFGLSGISADVQFGKAGGRVVYDAGNSVFKVTKADGSTLDNIRVATAPVHGNDAASKSYVDSRKTDVTDALTAEIARATAAEGVLTTNLAAEVIARIDGDADLQGQLDDEVIRATAAEGVLTTNLAAEVTRATAAEGVLTTNLASEVSARQTAVSEEATARADADTALGGRIDTEISDRAAAVSNEATARAQGDVDTLAAAKLYADGVASSQNQLSELVDVALTSSADGDLLMYNSATSKWENVDVNTTMINEGANLYFTEARARDSISVTTSGDGSLSYNSTTGVISYVGPSALETQAHFSAGTGVHYSAGEFSIGQAVETTSNVQFANGTFTGNLSVTGNVSIGGSITVAQSANVAADFTGNVMTLSGDLTVEGATNLNELVTVTSAATKAAGSASVNVFQVVSADETALKLFEVRQNGDAIIGGTLTVNGSSAALTGNLTTSGDATVSGDLLVGGTTTTASLIVTGNATFQANIYGNNMDLSGNLTVGDNLGTDLLVVNAEVDSDFIPHATGTFDLGSATQEWNKVYANNVYADLTGNVTGQISDITNHAGYVKGLLSAVDAGGDGSFSYDSATGAFTYTGPSAAEVRAHFSAGTGVAIADGVISIGQAVGTTSDVTFNDVTVNGTLFSNDITAADVTISGNLIVSGTTTTVNTETIALADNVILLNSNATGTPSQDAGIEIERGDSTNVSLLWDETTGRWTVGTKDFVAANFIGDLTGDVTGTVSDISNHTTDALAEGSTKLYYTDGRVAAYLLANAFATEAYTDAKVADKNSFVVRAEMGTSGAIGTIANVNGKTYYVSRVTVKVTSAYDATVSISDGANTLMTAAEIEEGVVGTYVAELPFATATTKGSTISLVSAATAGAALVTVEYVQL